MTKKSIKEICEEWFYDPVNTDSLRLSDLIEKLEEREKELNLQ